MDVENLNELRVVELKKELEIRGLSKNGSKKELVDRLRNYILLEEQKQPPADSDVSAQAPSLELNSDGQNEFVKSYLQQREQLMSQQMGDKKRYEEEASHSQSECETEDSNASPGKHSAAKSSAAKATRDDEQSDDSTDVEDSETSKQNIVHAGDGDKPDDSEKRLPSDVSQSRDSVKDVGSAVVQDVAATAPEDVHATRPRSRSSSASSGTRSHSPVRKHSEEHADQRSRSRSRSSGSGSRSRSSSSQSSRSRTRSRSNKRRSRSPSEEVKRVSGGDVVESEATKLEPQMPTKPVAQESDEPQHSSSDENDKHHQPMDTMKKDVVQAIELTGEESQYSIDNRLEVSGEVGDLQQQFDDLPQKNIDNQAPAENISKNNSNAEPDDMFTAAKPSRKRRWGSTSVREKPVLSINISTDSLRGLIPEISAGEIAAEDPVLEENVADDREDGELVSSPSQHKDLDLVLEDTRTTKIRRIVYDKEVSDSASKDVSVEMTLDDGKVNGDENEEPLVKAAKVTRTTSNEASKPVRTVSIITEDPVDVGQKSPSPARRPASNVVHVTGLVRPFTVGQLKELLGRTGTLADDGFWIDNIKSHCYAVYETAEEAVATRQALHGKRWPASNPKMLGVEFRNMEEFEFRKKGGAGSAAKPLTEPQPVENRGTRDRSVGVKEHGEAGWTSPHDVAKSHSRDAKEKVPVQPVREWDRHKLRQSPARERDDRDRRGREEKPTKIQVKKEPDQRDRERSRRDRRGRGKNDKSGAAAKVEEEPPAKLLDDLFRKTKALPCIYWLPLTDEQVAEKVAEAKRQEAMREQQRIERERQREAERLQRIKAREERRAKDTEREAKPPRRRKFSEAEDTAGRSRADRR